MEAGTVRRARVTGMSWAGTADLLGVCGQAAHRKYGGGTCCLCLTDHLRNRPTAGDGAGAGASGREPLTRREAVTGRQDPGGWPRGTRRARAGRPRRGVVGS